MNYMSHLGQRASRSKQDQELDMLHWNRTRRGLGQGLGQFDLQSNVVINIKTCHFSFHSARSQHVGNIYTLLTIYCEMTIRK